MAASLSSSSLTLLRLPLLCLLLLAPSATARHFQTRHGASHYGSRLPSPLPFPGITPLLGALPRTSSLSRAHHFAQDSGSVYWPGIRGEDGPLTYWGGPIKTEPIVVHVLFYGDWNSHDGKDQAVITNFIDSLDHTTADAPTVSKWWEIVTKGTTVTSKVKLGEVSVISDGYKTGLKDLFNNDVDETFQLLSQAVTDKKFPKDENAVYVIFTSADIKVGDASADYGGGFCSSYCGYHNSGLHGGVNLTYAFIGDPMQCSKGCAPFTNVTHNVTANGYSGPDMAVSIFAHELAEAATDPFGTGWATYGGGFENGDVCAWTYTDKAHPQVLYQKSPTFFYNLMGNNDYKYLVQTIPDVRFQECLVQPKE